MGWHAGRQRVTPEGASDCSDCGGQHQQPQDGRRLRGWLRLVRLTPLIVAGAMGVALLAGCGDENGAGAIGASNTLTVQQSAAAGAFDTITVVGKGKVTSAPDEAVLTITVESDGADASAALNSNSESATKVVSQLKTEGVEDSAIETAGVTVYPVRSYDPQTGKETLTGYRAQNSVTVTLKEASLVGKVFAAAVAMGANNVNGPVWQLSDDSVVITAALKEATANARTKAEAVATAQGVKLGAVVAITEGSVEVPTVSDYGGAYAEAAAGDKVTTPPINPSAIDVTATVTVTYKLVP